jgi:sortase A
MKAILKLDSPRDHGPVSSRRWLAGLEWFFLLAGLAAVDTYVWVNASSLLSQAYQDWSFDQTLRGVAPSVGGFLSDEISWMFGSQRERVQAPEATADTKIEPLPTQTPPLPSSVIGRLQIPRLQLTAMVREGADGKTLHHAVGHIPGTALPGAFGNVALAGHRDTFFRELRNIRKDDVIEFETENGTYRYVVESTEVVGPRDVGVLAASNGRVLTLVTCYPFYYIGSAPKRFIVRATQLSPSPQRLRPQGS